MQGQWQRWKGEGGAWRDNQVPAFCDYWLNYGWLLSIHISYLCFLFVVCISYKSILWLGFTRQLRGVAGGHSAVWSLTICGLIFRFCILSVGKLIFEQIGEEMSRLSCLRALQLYIKYVFLTNNKMFNGKFKTSQKLRNYPHSRYSKYSKYSMYSKHLSI